MSWFADFAEIVKENEPLAPRTWFNLGGPARYFVQPRNVVELQQVVARLRENNIPMYVLGGGANLLVKDSGVDGAVLCLDQPEFKKMQVRGESHVYAGAGYDMQRLVKDVIRLGLGGLECLAGIPGTVGGELKMNAGGAFGDIGSHVLEVEVMDQSGQIYLRKREDLVFEYRRSNINARFILGAVFDLTPDAPDRLNERLREVWMYKKNTQPLAPHSAGCIFRNSNGVSAGKLIDQAGLKGLRVGGAEVSERHANFITAAAGSTSADVLSLITQVRDRVRDKFDIILEPEVVIW